MSRIPVINFGNRGGGQPSDDERMRRALRALVQQQEQPAPQVSPLRQRADMREAMRMSALAGMAEQTGLKREANANLIGGNLQREAMAAGDYGLAEDRRQQTLARTPRLSQIVQQDRQFQQDLTNQTQANLAAIAKAEGARAEGEGSRLQGRALLEQVRQAPAMQTERLATERDIARIQAMPDVADLLSRLQSSGRNVSIQRASRADGGTNIVVLDSQTGEIIRTIRPEDLGETTGAAAPANDAFNPDNYLPPARR